MLEWENRVTGLVDLLIVNYQNTELRYENYMSIVTCREVLEYHGILYFGEYLSVSL